jgi:hypothetical protein
MNNSDRLIFRNCLRNKCQLRSVAHHGQYIMRCSKVDHLPVRTISPCHIQWHLLAPNSRREGPCLLSILPRAWSSASPCAARNQERWMETAVHLFSCRPVRSYVDCWMHEGRKSVPSFHRPYGEENLQHVLRTKEENRFNILRSDSFVVDGI